MKRYFLTMAGAALAALTATGAGASVVYLANGSISGSAAGAGVDLSGLTGTLENGLPGNILGGLGSGLTYAGGTTFLAVPDRGPNATAYNPMVDDTTSFISRFQTLDLALVPSNGALPFSLSTALTKTTLLSSPMPLTYGSGAGLGNRSDGSPLGSGAPAINTDSAYYFTGRSDNYGAGSSGNALNARFDPEAVAVSNDGASVYISDEYGPYVRQFDRTTGALVKTFALPANLDVTNLSPMGQTEIDGNAIGRVANKGMEGLAITPDGKTLVGFMQAPLEQDVAKLVRIVTIDVATGATKEFAYKLTTGTGVSDVVAINDHEFLVDERDGKGLGDGSNAKIKQFFRIDVTGATDITALAGAAANAATAVKKSATPILDLVAALKAAGLTEAQIPAKIEGLAFGADVSFNGKTLHTLYIANDNDFVPGLAGPNQFFVFGFEDGDLPGYTPQALSAVPEPGVWAMMLIGFGAIGTALRRRGQTVATVTA